MTAENSTAPATAETPAKKARAPRRVTTLVVGRWNDEGHFRPASIQPTGKAQREQEALRAWLRQEATVNALLAEGFTQVSVVRKELVEASYKQFTATKVSIT
ncbi:MAG: hypothetical protein GX565_01165 [Lentisphaerae bacterium]|nr:hypothetical protein [Lentisphaerota bacterium]